MARKSFLTLMATLLSALMSCMLIQASAAADPRPGKLIWTSAQALVSADAHMWDLRGDEAIRWLYTESLVKHIGWEEYGPGLATSWEASPDKKVWTFKLRRGVKFSNGDPLTAMDVVWSALRCRDMPIGTLRGYFKSLKEAKALDDYTVQLVFTHSDPVIFNNIYKGLRVYSKAQADRDGKNFFEKFIGTGPWKLVDWKPGQYIRFERNPTWWGEFAPGAPTMIEHRQIKEVSTQMAALLAGEVDLVEHLPTDSLKNLQTSDAAYSIRRPGALTVSIGMRNDTPPFNNSKLRQAMDYLVPRQSIVKDLLGGGGEPSISWSRPLQSWFPEELKGKVKPFDTNRAKSLIAESNYKGEEIRLITRRGRVPKDIETCELLNQIWKSVGLNIKVEVLADSAYAQRRAAGNYEMFYTSWGFDSPAFTYGSKLNDVRINRAKVDPTFAEMIKALLAEPDSKRYVAKVQDIERHFYQDPVALHVWYEDFFWGVSNRVQIIENTGGSLNVLYEKSALSPTARAVK